ncbi:DUF4160 domain-containing protein [Tunicatimonas pelagia]|uniref:DUF4160 domain-containing protein n=1 Tax=Tunicatimonas pelagia TaxID=931531 RepID=UPI0026667B27|nr:DUF4160 domain-containing protein [Tunicatimonas pelagia]WKN41240.1 DUF4160 domain-containing protein [Tunicatimonas pelagia]
MPKLYEYLGIIIFFYSNEHEPIHVHARSGEFESKAEIIVVDGIVEEIVITNIRGRKPLKGKELNHLKKFIEHYADAVVDKWVEYFVYHREVDFEKVTQRL